MYGFLKAKGAYIVAFLFVFLLFGNVTMAQDEPVLFEDYEDMEWTADDMAQDEPLLFEDYEDVEWDAQTWEDDDYWDNNASADDDGFDWGYGTTTTPDMTGPEAAMAFGLVMVIWAIIMLPMYIYFALTLMTIAKKLGISSAWFAWVPVLNLILLCRCAGITSWFFLAFFVPVVNVIVGIYTYMKIAERRGFESWLGILIIVPVAQIIIPGYLAWGEPPKKGE